nr:hypothetical protein [uncultured Noviherbaspirillum sp.]
MDEAVNTPAANHFFRIARTGNTDATPALFGAGASARYFPLLSVS